MHSEIRLLPQNLINQIAAGEVVERPASAVKELVENAIDAGSSRIDIKITEGGKTYFAISDNGKGMTPDELALAVERHATSKLPDEDLFHINFLGFRGEALPSIASVSKLTISSRTPHADQAWQIKVLGGQKGQISPVAHGNGTTIEVHDLFYATPARLKFLKTAQTESGYIKDIINRLAMAYPHIHFTLSDEKRLILNYAATESLFTRVSQVIGRSFNENAVPVEASYNNVVLTGFVGLPTHTRSTSGDQYLFVNGRFIKDKMLAGAVRGAFQGLISHEKHPVLALFLSVQQDELDVNVHPAKTEVRFQNAAGIRGLLVASIRNALAENGHKTSSTIGVGALEKSMPSILPAEKRAAARFSFAEPQPQHQQTIAFNENAFGLKTTADFAPAAFEDKIESWMPKKEPMAHSETEQMPPLGFAKAQLHKTYIISQNENAIVITDQHAAHERLTYENLSVKIGKNLEVQMLLIPQIIDLKPDEVALLNDRAEELKAFGFVVDAFGQDSVAVREVPALLMNANLTNLLHDLVDSIKEFDDTILLKDKITDICARMACHGSIRAGRELTLPEMNALLREMEACGTSGQCIHGRPTYIELKLSDIERLFGRSK